MASPTNQDTNTARASGHLLSTLEERLKGLLCMEIGDAFLDREHRCVSQVALVVSLDLVATKTGHKETLPRALQQTLDAVATLYTYTEGLRSSNTTQSQFNSFWMRVFASSMMKSSWDPMRDLPSIQSTLRCLYAVGLYVKLSWQDQPLVPLAIEAIRVFLHAPRAKYERLAGGRCRHPSGESRPLQVAIDLSKCELKETHLKRLMEALQVSEQNSGATLCDRGVLRALQLTGNPLDTAELNAIAKLFESPLTRRIDCLGLIDAMPRGHQLTRTTNAKAYKTAFKRLMVAAFRSNKIAADKQKDHGFALSLARNDGLPPSHITALWEALEGGGVSGTRPLRALSFAGVEDPDDLTHHQIAKLLFDHTALATSNVTDNCQLDLSKADVTYGIADGLAQLVRASTPQVTRALEGDVPVYCRVLCQTEATKDLSRSTLYKVVGVSTTSGHSFSIAVPRAAAFESPPTSAADASIDDRVESPGPVVERWLSANEISFVRIGDADIIRSRFTSLVLDSNGIYNDQPSMVLLEAMGQDLKCLALRKYGRLYEFIESVLARCPRLEELNLDHSRIQVEYSRAVPLWARLTNDNWRSLQVLSMVGSRILTKSLATLTTTLAGVPDLALQYLCLGEDTTFNGERLRIVRDLLLQNKSIQEITIGCSFLNFDVACGVWKNESAENAVLRDQIDQELRVEGLSLESRLAFVSVLPTLSTAVQRHLDNGVITEIFKFADAKKARQVTWY